MYYTNDHEWIEYRGYTALVGICKGKLSGDKELLRVEFAEDVSNMVRGSVIATFYLTGNSFFVSMPVDGKIIEFNKKLIETPSLIVSWDQHQRSVWIAKISPNAPYKREGLLQSHQYKPLKKKANNTANG
ncbi:MAG: hypothetical protein WC756_21090 [Taibaiella sp.]|jgi:glycine cleavage system H protein